MDLLTLMMLAKTHWDTIMLLVTFGGGAVALLKNQAYKQFGLLCLKLVAEVAVLELSGPDKRKAVVDGAYSMAPAWVKRLVPVERAEQEAEKAYQLLKGQLKQSK